MNTHCFTKRLSITLLALLFAACTGSPDDQTETDVAAATGPAASQPNTTTQQPAADLCLAHAVAANICFICDADLRDPGRLWCREHGRYEDRCLECHPELRDENRLYCQEHGLYEDECFYCHPELIPGTSTAAPGERGAGAASPGPGALYCREHDVYEAECGICQPALADDLKPGQGLKIRLPSTASETTANIVAKRARPGPARPTIHAVGELRFNQNRLVHVTPFTDGVVLRVHADLGQQVAQGQVLAELRSPAIAESKAALLKAAAEETVSSEALSRARRLHGQNVMSDQDLYDAEARYATALASLRVAEQLLLDLGFDRRALERIVSQQEATSVLTLAAPFAGTVIERDAVVGDVVAMGERVFSVADLGTMWLNLAVSEKDVLDLRVGQRVEIRSRALDGEIAGQITWISSRLNETTRMAEVIAEVANPSARLRAGMFVDATIFVGQSSTSLLVPRDTVHRFGGNAFVFVRLAGDLYELRRVETSAASGDLTAVTAGLADHDRIAMERSYLLKSEFQKSRLGAGCVD
jgi:cobalt-zinc-cadmium efflux system membrane fusion protein